MSWQSVFTLGTTGPTGSVLYSNGNGKLLSSDTFTVGETAVNLGKDLVPTSDAVYNLGATGFRWGEIFVGPGTINIAGPSGSDANGLIGTDNNSIIYTQRGFATPFINIGPSEDVLLEPGLIGGWRVGPTGTIGEAEYDLVAQAIDPTGGATGPTYSLIKRVGPTGATGETGPQGSASNVTGPTGPTGASYRTTGSWTLSTGANTVSFTVPINGAYSLWVNGNIPNGIVVYTATVVVTNSNVPVIGTSYGWYYADGNALVLTSIPTQVIGTANSISTATVVGSSNNTFTFGITNNSGSSKVVNWGYTLL